MAVEIEWIDSTSPQATGNKIYRDDVEIADIANGVQFYLDDTPEVGTDYKYEVQARDGSGDVTTREEEGVNMDYIRTVDGNIYPQDNAASTSPEVDGIGTWYDEDAGDSTLISDATEQFIGLYSLKQECTQDSSSARWEVDFEVESGLEYEVRFWYKTFIPATADRNPRLYPGDNCTLPTEYVTLISEDWGYLVTTLTATATGTASLQFYVAPAGGDIGSILWVDDISIKVPVLTSNLYPQDNAASTNPEVFSKGSWVNATSGEITPINTDSYAGNYSLSVKTITGGGSARVELDFPTESGKDYKLTFRAKRGSGGGTGGQTVLLNDGSTFGNTPITTETWDEYSIEWGSTLTGDTAIVAYSSWSGGVVGDELLIDSVELVEVV